MNSVELLAYVIAPLALLTLGWGVALWARHYPSEDRRQTPAE